MQFREVFAPTREDALPHQPAEDVHDRLRTYLRELPIELPYAASALNGRSTSVVALRHTPNRYIAVICIPQVHEQVNIVLLTALLRREDERLTDRDVIPSSELLRTHCAAAAGGLAPGTRSTADLVDIYLGLLIDAEIGPWCDTQRIAYTRTLDELTFSSKAPISDGVQQQILDFLRERRLRTDPGSWRTADRATAATVVHGLPLSPL